MDNTNVEAMKAENEIIKMRETMSALEKKSCQEA